MVAQLIQQPHPITLCAQQATATVNESTAYAPVFMTTADKRDALLAIDQLERRTTALKLRVMAASADLADQDGARDIAAWLAPRTQADPGPVRQQQRIAQAVDQRWSQVAAGMAAGQVSLEQAQVMVRGLEELPDRLGVDVITRAEAHLVELAEMHTPTELRLLIGRLLELVAPEIAEAEDALRLEKQEQKARDNCRLNLKPQGDGSTRLSGMIPDAAAQRLATYLDAYTSPRKHEDAISGEEDRIPYPRKLGLAFCALLERLDPEQLPEHGGDATSVTVTVTLDALKKQLATGALITGEGLSATQVRRLACNAKIIPAVLGSKGEILDLGRARRLFTRAQRKALALRDKVCFEEHCTVPARRCEAHHLKPWSEGGKTDLKDGRLGCSYHHHRIHDPHYTHEILPNGKIRFHRNQ